jgi:hypothetical protein
MQEEHDPGPVPSEFETAPIEFEEKQQPVKRRRRPRKPPVKAIEGPRSDQQSGPWLSIPYESSLRHYGKRKSVPWIKLEAAWLADYRFQRLADHQKLALICLWMLSAKERRIPADPEYLQWRLALSSPVDLRGLVEGGWLELHGARLDYLPSVGVRRVVDVSAIPVEEKPLVWPPPEEDADETAKQVEDWENRQPI